MAPRPKESRAELMRLLQRQRFETERVCKQRGDINQELVRLRGDARALLQQLDIAVEALIFAGFTQLAGYARTVADNCRPSIVGHVYGMSPGAAALQSIRDTAKLPPGSVSVVPKDEEIPF